jgi:hypothetical protein
LTALLKADPFADETEGPKYIRIDKYRYKFKIIREKEKDMKSSLIGNAK